MPWLVIVTSLAAVSDAGVLISPAALKSVILPAVATISASLLASKRSPCVVESEMSPATALIAPVSVTPNFAFTSTSCPAIRLLMLAIPSPAFTSMLPAVARTNTLVPERFTLSAILSNAISPAAERTDENMTISWPAVKTISPCAERPSALASAKAFADAPVPGGTSGSRNVIVASSPNTYPLPGVTISTPRIAPLSIMGLPVAA